MMEDPHKQVYITVPRKLAIAVLTSFTCLFIGVIASFQYTDFVDRRSNQRWCGIVALFNSAYVENPPTTNLGKEIAVAMLNLETDFSCR
jgi:hypothetical protein